MEKGELASPFFISPEGDFLVFLSEIIFFLLLFECQKVTKKAALSRFLDFQEKVKVATLYGIVLQFYPFFLKAKKLLAKGEI